MKQNPAALALTPLLLFLVLFIGSGVYFTLQGNAFGFYELNPAFAAIPAVLLALTQKPAGLRDKLTTFWQGMSHGTVLTMCLIFALAGAFTVVAKNTGGVEATVNMGLSFIPSWLLLPGFFVITAFISTAMGTSTGTIAAAAPVALGVAQSTGIPLPLMAGAVLSGAMFGDNLSIISDTTIAATRSQGCAMIDKLKENFFIALPAAILVAIIYFLVSPHAGAEQVHDYQLIRVMPYFVILALALMGVNVFVVLAGGILMAGVIGLWFVPGYYWPKLIADIAAGVWSMHDIIILSLLLGGLGALMERGGGIAFLIANIERHIIRPHTNPSQKAQETRGEVGIAALVSSVNLCTANNTIAIIVSAKAARHISETYSISKKRTASLLDIFSCVVQGLIPWGAQLLLLGASFSMDPVGITVWAFYPAALGVVALLFAIFKPR